MKLAEYQDGNGADHLPPLTWRMFFRDRGARWNRWGWYFPHNSGQKANAFHYMDWLFGRLERRRYVSVDQRRKLWKQAVRKYGYGGRQGPLEKRSYFSRYSDNIASICRETAPASILDDKLKPAYRCELCGSPTHTEEWIYDPMTEQMADRWDSEKCWDCTHPACDDIKSWRMRVGPEVKKAIKLGVTIHQRKFKDSMPLIGYLDFVARLKTKEDRDDLARLL